MKTYGIHEIFYSIQGEGVRTGISTVFVRFSRCNLACPWCDTDNDGPLVRMTADEILAEAIQVMDAADPLSMVRNVIFTGGEPALQLDAELLHRFANWFKAIETNGTVDLAQSGVESVLDWITVSPKFDQPGWEKYGWRQKRGHELKLVFPHLGPDPIHHLRLPFAHFLIQPVDDGANYEDNLRECIAWVQKIPRYRLSVQAHKHLLNVR